MEEHQCPASDQFFQVREGTWDSKIVDHVFGRNEYQIDLFDPDDIIMDVGGHIGSFSRLAHHNGCRNIYCFEANPHNQYMCYLNFIDHPGITLRETGLWRSDTIENELRFNVSSDVENTGGGGISPNGTQVVPVMPFDLALTNILHENNAKSIRYLKLDCEGSEFPILMTSKELHRVEEIGGEFHLGFCVDKPINGKTTFDLTDILVALSNAGFHKIEFQFSKKDRNYGYFKGRK